MKKIKTADMRELLLFLRLSVFFILFVGFLAGTHDGSRIGWYGKVEAKTYKINQNAINQLLTNDRLTEKNRRA